VIIGRGDERAFCAGGDVKRMSLPCWNILICRASVGLEGKQANGRPFLQGGIPTELAHGKNRKALRVVH